MNVGKVLPYLCSRRIAKVVLFVQCGKHEHILNLLYTLNSSPSTTTQIFTCFTYLFKYLFITEKRSLAIDFQLNYFEYFKPITCYRIPIPFSKQQITHHASRTLSSLEQSFRPSHTPYSYKCHAFSYSIATWFAAESS